MNIVGVNSVGPSIGLSARLRAIAVVIAGGQRRTVGSALKPVQSVGAKGA
jgi:hypothetical protein